MSPFPSPPAGGKLMLSKGIAVREPFLSTAAPHKRQTGFDYIPASCLEPYQNGNLAKKSATSASPSAVPSGDISEDKMENRIAKHLRVGNRQTSFFPSRNELLKRLRQLLSQAAWWGNEGARFMVARSGPVNWNHCSQPTSIEVVEMCRDISPVEVFCDYYRSSVYLSSRDTSNRQIMSQSI
jgi:hypothetical protein